MGGGRGAPGDELSASDDADAPRDGRGGGTADAEIEDGVRAGNLGGPATGLPGRAGAEGVGNDGVLAALPPVRLGGGGSGGFAGFDLEFTRGGGNGGGASPL